MKMTLRQVIKIILCLLFFVGIFKLASNNGFSETTNILVRRIGRYKINTSISSSGTSQENSEHVKAVTQTHLASILVDISSINSPPSIKKSSHKKNANHGMVVIHNATHKKILQAMLNMSRDTIKHPQSESEKRKRVMSGVIFNSGIGLTAKDDVILVENGVIYRPISNLSSTHEKYPPPRITDYEPCIPFNETIFFKDRQALNRAKISQKKIILWYTPARYAQPMAKPQVLRFCPEFPCLMTTNRVYANKSALLVFNGQLVGENPPKRSSQKQLFMFHNQEPPVVKFFDYSKFHRPQWKDAFNWTMSYRLDSDFPSLYGIIRKRPKPSKKNYKAILSNKKHLVAWMVSHCGSPSKRDTYVKELTKYIDVDVYGNCGKFKCERNSDEKCSQDIAGSYKFYLGFENALCPDYVSEKFFKFMSMNIITVARTSSEITLHAPSDIFINTADFSSPKKLAEHLVYLDNNDEEYVKMLQAKDKYIYLFEDFPIREPSGYIKYVHYHYESVPFCQVCHRLWNLDKGKYIVPDITEWFNRKLCHEPTDLNF